MDDPRIDKLEVQAIRREVEDIRREIEALEKLKLSRPEQEHPSGREGFMFDFQIALGDQILRQPAEARIEQRIAAVEKRIAELEERYGVNATLN